nr:GNAT family protein [Streptomyces toyocaensis]
MDESDDVRERGEGAGALERDTDEFVEDRRAFPGRAVPVHEGSHPAGRVHRGLPADGGDMDRGGRCPHRGTVSRCSPADLEMGRGGEVPRQAVGQNVLGLRADVFGSDAAHRWKRVKMSGMSSPPRWNTLDVHRIEWWAMVGNTGSRAVAEKLGFTVEGTLRRRGVANDGESRKTGRWADC